MDKHIINNENVSPAKVRTVMLTEALVPVMKARWYYLLLLTLIHT
jgi:hypothetical protein